jgi:hypothetical protein
MVVVSRAPTPTIEPQEVIRPRAEPVDTYIRPPDPAPSDLHNLARGLENFSRDIRGMFAAREQRDEEAARLRGEAQFFQDNAVGYAEAVRQGRVPAYASRPFMEAYKQAEGRLIGARLSSQMQLEYNTWEGRNDQDPANFDVFMADFLRRNLSTNDPDILRGAMPYIYSSVNAGYTQRTQDAANAAYAGGLNAQIAVSSITIDDASVAGLETGQGTDLDGLWQELVRNRETALSSGIRTLDYDEKLIDLIAAKALEERDPALLSLLDRPLPGSDAAISATPYGRTVMDRTISAMQTVNTQAENAAYTAQQRRDAALKDELTQFAIEAISRDPNVVLPDNFWEAFTRVQPDARIKVQDWRNAIINGQEEDGEAIASLTYRVLIGQENAMAVIDAGVQSGAIRDAATLKRLYDLGQETPVWQSSQAYRLGLQAIQTAADRGGQYNFDPNYVSPAATAASLDFELSMRAWAQTPEGQAAIASGNTAAIATETARIQKVITDAIVGADNAPAIYVQPTAITEDLREAGFAPNPQVSTQEELDEVAAAEARAAEAAAAEAELPAWRRGWAPPNLDTLPPDAQAAIREEAERLGVDPQAFINDAHRREHGPEVRFPEWTQDGPPDLNSLPPEEQTLLREEADRMGIDPQILLDETYRQVDQIIREIDGEYGIEQGIEDVLNNPPPTQLPPLAPPVQQGPQSQANPAVYNPAGAPSVVQGGGPVPRAPSGGVAPAPGFVDPRENTSDILQEVLDRYSDRRLPASIRLNNMGGISITGDINGSWAARQPGFVGVVARPANEGGFYAQYATPEDGVRAASNLLINYGERGINTPMAIADRWAEGSISQYANTTVRFLREAGYEVSTSTRLDLSNPEIRLAILRAKSAHESGFGRPIYADAIYERAVLPPNVALAYNQ